MKNRVDSRILIFLICIFAAGIAGTGWVASSTAQQMRAELLRQARIAAQAVSIEHVASLSGSAEDLNKPGYRRIKSQLKSMRAAVEKCRFLYLMGRRSDGKVFFFVDSLPPDSEDYAPPGLVYDEVSDSYIRTFETNAEAVVGPVTDRWGTLVTALVPLNDPSKGTLVAVLGMDVDARYWQNEIISRCLFPLTTMLFSMFLTLLLFSREKVARSLRQSENKLRATLDATPFPVAVVDVDDDRILYWSHSALTLFGHTAPTASEWYQIAYPDPDYRREVIDRWKSFLETARLSGQPTNTGEYRVTCKDGTVRTCELFATFLSDCLIVTFNDVTERKKADAALEKSKSLLDTTGRMARVGGWEVDAATLEVLWTEETYRIHEVPSNRKPSLKDAIEFFHPEDRPKLEQAMQRALEQGESYDMVMRFVTANGKHLWTRTQCEPAMKDGKVVALKGTFQDITALKTAEEENRRLELQLRQAHKMEAVGNLAGGIAHDFNNILASIIGFTELALDEVDQDSQTADSLQEVYKGGLRAKELVQQILTFARQSEEEIKPVQPARITEEVVTFIRSTIPTSIEIRTNIESDAFIMGNGTQVHQILMNLCSNAAHAMEDEGGLLEIGIRDRFLQHGPQSTQLGLRAGDYLEIRVADTGKGIPPEIIDSIFDPYFTTKDVGEGSGMGLAVTQGIVEAYGGKITVDSVLKKETVFTAYLPVAKNRMAKQAHRPAKPPSGTEGILPADRDDENGASPYRG